MGMGLGESEEVEGDACSNIEMAGQSSEGYGAAAVPCGRLHTLHCEHACGSALPLPALALRLAALLEELPLSWLEERLEARLGASPCKAKA